MGEKRKRYPLVPGWWLGQEGDIGILPQWMREGAEQYGYPQLSESDYFDAVAILLNSLLEAGQIDDKELAQLSTEIANQATLEGIHSGLPYYKEVVSRRMPSYLAQSGQDYQNQLLGLQGQYPYGNLGGVTPAELSRCRKTIIPETSTDVVGGKRTTNKDAK